MSKKGRHREGGDDDVVERGANQPSSNRGGAEGTSAAVRQRGEATQTQQQRNTDASTTTASKKDKSGKSAAKAAKRAKLLAHLSVKSSGTVTPANKQALAFENADEADHCETPFKAYRDIEPFLFALAKALKKTKSELRIYDPYFCEGSMVAHLNALGFENVYNRNEDFYERVATKTTPEFDVLVTNPPYSGDHFKRILSYCRACGKPWLLLLPNFVCRKSYYAPSIGDAAKPLFLIPDPAKPYRYWAPGRKGFDVRAKGTTPFETFWYIEFAGVLDPEEQRAWWLKKYKAHSTCDIPALDQALPQQQRLQKRPNPKVRAILAAKGVKTHTTTSGIYFNPEKAKKRGGDDGDERKKKK